MKKSEDNCNKMNAKVLLKHILNSLQELDRQKQFRIADKIFNNLRLAENVEPKTFFELLDELDEYAQSLETLKAGYKSLSLKYHPDTNDNDPIATENFKQLQMAYKRLLSEINKTKSMNAWEQSLLAKPMTPDKAEIKWEGRASYENDKMYLSPEQVSQIFVDDYKISMRRKLKNNNPETQEEINNTPPIKAPSSEYDIDDVLDSVMDFAENLLSYGYDMKIPNREGATEKTPHVMNVELSEEQAKPLIIIPKIKWLTVTLWYYDEKGNYKGLSSTRFEPEPNQISDSKGKLLK